MTWRCYRGGCGEQPALSDEFVQVLVVSTGLRRAMLLSQRRPKRDAADRSVLAACGVASGHMCHMRNRFGQISDFTVTPCRVACRASRSESSSKTSVVVAVMNSGGRRLKSVSKGEAAGSLLGRWTSAIFAKFAVLHVVVHQIMGRIVGPFRALPAAVGVRGWNGELADQALRCSATFSARFPPVLSPTRSQGLRASMTVRAVFNRAGH
jgi:hypothetical protein